MRKRRKSTEKIEFGRRAFSGWTDYRHGGAKPISLAGAKTRGLLSAPKRERLTDRLFDLVGTFRQTPFEHEGPSRHGLRQAFCMDGHSWQRSDDEAATVVAEALRRTGVDRPSWEQGQRDAAFEFEYCSWCSGPLDDERRGRRQRFCSMECARMTLNRRDLRDMNHDGGVLFQAKALVARQALPFRNCRMCGSPFQNPKASAVFCSPVCAQRARWGDQILADRTCDGCGYLFHPRSRNDRFCSHACRTATVKAETVVQFAASVLRCEECESEFTPASAHQRYCGDRCRKRASERAVRLRNTPSAEPLPHACRCCGEIFVSRASFALYCSPACKECAKRYEAGRLKTMVPRTFDYMARRMGSRLTTETALAA